DGDNPAGVPRSELDAWQREGLVEWWGHRSDMPEVVRQANVVCLPSYREGMPRALLEAAAMGRAIVTTDVPGCRDAVAQGKIGRLGGLGIFAAFLITVISLFAGNLLPLEGDQLRLGMGLLVGGGVMFLVGLYDDLKTLRALYKLYGQILAAAIAWHFGFRVDA